MAYSIITCLCAKSEIGTAGSSEEMIPLVTFRGVVDPFANGITPEGMSRNAAWRKKKRTGRDQTGRNPGGPRTLGPLIWRQDVSPEGLSWRSFLLCVSFHTLGRRRRGRLAEGTPKSRLWPPIKVGNLLLPCLVLVFVLRWIVSWWPWQLLIA